MSEKLTFILELQVDDPEALHEAAWDRYMEENVVTSREKVEEALGKAGAIDIEACLVTLLDPGALPGCSVDFSHCTEN